MSSLLIMVIQFLISLHIYSIRTKFLESVNNQNGRAVFFNSFHFSLIIEQTYLVPLLLTLL